MFVKYIHLERYGTDEVDGITLGRCHVFPKLDGTNASVWLDDDGGYDDGLTMFCGSRNRILTLADDNQGFANWAITHTPLRSLLYTLPRGSRVYGEWLVPHTIKAYREDAWRRFYVFDVLTPAGEFMHYDEYMPLCKAHGVDFIPAMLVGNNPTYDVLHIEAQNNKFLMQENQGHGEGVVIKQYGWKNRFGRTVWAKLVTNTFKDAHVAEMGGKTINTTMVEEQIANEFVTQHMVDKIVAKIRVEHGSFSAQRIPQLLGMAFHDLVTEELWQAIKQHKNPKIDFKALNTFAIARVKTLLPELFGVRK